MAPVFSGMYFLFSQGGTCCILLMYTQCNVAQLVFYKKNEVHVHGFIGNLNRRPFARRDLS